MVVAITNAQSYGGETSRSMKREELAVCRNGRWRNIPFHQLKRFLRGAISPPRRYFGSVNFPAGSYTRNVSRATRTQSVGGPHRHAELLGEDSKRNVMLHPLSFEVATFCTRQPAQRRASQSFAFARAFANPDSTRSAIKDLSNWATAPIIWNTSSPAGTEVSTASVTSCFVLRRCFQRNG